MPESRNPFEYVSWCAGPSVDISPLIDFPICDVVNYNVPTLNLHHVQMTVPDLAPPPMCPCIWSSDTEAPGYASIAVTNISRHEASGRIAIVPRYGEELNCCDPTYDVEFDLQLPCIPFDFTVTGTSTGIGTFDLALIPIVSECVVRLSYAISIPCIAFSVTADSTINIGSIDLALAANTADCELKVSAKISLPAAEQTVIVSVRLDEINGFQVYKKTLRIYQVVSDIGWVTVIGVGSCTN